MITPAPPFFVVDDAGDIDEYPALEHMHGQLEGIDVEDGIYKIFDSQGRLMRLHTSGVERNRFVIAPGTLTHIECLDYTSIAEEQFKNYLRTYLLRVGVPMEVDTPLQNLLVALRRNV